MKKPKQMPAAAGVPALTAAYYVYEYVRREDKRVWLQAVVHQADCRWCQNGQGRQSNAGMRDGLGRWHGPFAAVQDAQATAVTITGEALACKRCQPY